jgi:hypothetical protein
LAQRRQGAGFVSLGTSGVIFLVTATASSASLSGRCTRFAAMRCQNRWHGVAMLSAASSLA